jgi:chromosome segregation ATPase
MSGAPNAEQIGRLREVLRKAADERKEIEQAESERSRADLKIDSAKHRLDKLEREARELLKAMDCGPDGNAGSGSRQLVLLSALVMQPEKR